MEVNFVPITLRSASIWKSTVALLVGFAAFLIPAMVILTYLGFMDVVWAKSAIGALGGFSEGGVGWRLLLANVELISIYILSLSIVSAISIWVGTRFNSVVFRKAQRTGFDVIQPRPDVRDIVERLTFVRCIKDLFIGMAWTAVLLGIPIITILILTGELSDTKDDVITRFVALTFGILILVVVSAPILMLGFWIVRGVTGLLKRSQPVAI